MTALIGLALGATLALGVLVALAGWTGAAPVAARALTAPSLVGDGLLPARAALAAAAGGLAWAATGWPAATVVVGVGAAFGSSLVGAGRRRAAAIARTEAIAGWAEMLRDTMAAAAGLQEAIVTTARLAPPALRPEVRALAARVQREPFVPALRAFAADVSDPIADLVVAALLVAVERQGGSVGEILGSAAATARANATMRLRVEAGRARTYTSTRLIVAVTLAFAGGLLVLNRGYLEPFDTAVGQLVLLAIGGLFAAALWSLARLGRVDAQDRLLAAVAEEGSG